MQKSSLMRSSVVMMRRPWRDDQCTCESKAWRFTKLEINDSVVLVEVAKSMLTRPGDDPPMGGV